MATKKQITDNALSASFAVIFRTATVPNPHRLVQDMIQVAYWENGIKGNPNPRGFSSLADVRNIRILDASPTRIYFLTESGEYGCAPIGQES